MKTKLLHLFKEDRRLKERLILAFCVSFAMYFTFVFFGPFEITVSSGGSILIYPAEVIKIMLPLAFVLTLLTVFVLAFLKGRIFDIAIFFISYITIGGYIQGNLLNGKLGTLTGVDIEWTKQTNSMIIGLLVWLFIFAILILVVYLKSEDFNIIIKYGSIILVIMQSVATLTLAASSISEHSFLTEESVFISKEDMFQFSEKDNTIVFLIDALDYDYIEGIRNLDPDFFEPLEGFVEYTNAVGDFANTRPGGASLLGNTKEAFTMPTNDFYADIFENDQNNIFSGLDDAGYMSDVYAELFYLTNNSEGQMDKIASIKKEKNKVNTKKAICKLMDLSMYRYVPIAIKPFYWTHTAEINADLRLHGDGTDNTDETVFDQGIEKMTLDKEKRFKFYHFNGSHPPYSLTEEGIRSESPTDAITQTKGSFEILYRAFGKMKELGIYEDASIIIAADHGFAEYPMTKSTRVGVFYKEKGKHSTPLQFSDEPVMLSNIPATILKASNANYEHLGIPLDEVTSDGYSPRIHKSVVQEDKESKLYIYSVAEDASKFENWELISKDFIKKSFWY